MANNDSSRFGRLKKYMGKGLIALAVIIVLLAAWLFFSLTRTDTSDLAEGVREEVAVSSSQDGDGLDRVVPQTPIEGQRIVGLAFTQAIIGTMEGQLDRTFGWRPNDIIFSLFTDNVENYQLGMLEVLRRTMLAFNDKLARFGSTYPLNPHLNKAFTGFNFRPTKFWFPSSESVYRNAVKELKIYRDGLGGTDQVKKGESASNFFPRADNLHFLVGQIREVLGSTQNLLTRQAEDDGSAVSWWQVDDYFYHAYGAMTVTLNLFRAIRVDFEEEIKAKSAMPLVDDIIRSLAKPVRMLNNSEPLIITDRPINSIFNNHRAHINRPLADVRQKISSFQATLLK